MTQQTEPITNVATQEWSPQIRRSGAIAKKIGQYPLWKKDGTKIRTTLLQVIIQIRYIYQKKIIVFGAFRLLIIMSLSIFHRKIINLRSSQELNVFRNIFFFFLF